MKNCLDNAGNLYYNTHNLIPHTKYAGAVYRMYGSWHNEEGGGRVADRTSEYETRKAMIRRSNRQ